MSAPAIASESRMTERAMRAITALRWRNCADQNIVHVSIVLGAGFE
jgi:hypothetical protein